MVEYDYKVSYNNKGQNSSTLNALSLLPIADIDNARQDANLPHNAAVISNLDTTSTLYVYLEYPQDQDLPDYVIFPNQQMVINRDDGVSFSTIVLKNTHATNNIAAKAIKYNIMTIKRFRVD